VHLNLPFREPLVPTGEPLVDAPGRSDGRPWTARAPGERTPGAALCDALVDLVRANPRGLVVAGWGADVDPGLLLAFGRAAGWPVLADAISGLRVPGTISTYDPLLRGDAFAASHRPDVVLRLGGPLSNKVATQWLDPGIGQVLVDPDAAWLDPSHAASGRVVADPGPLLAAVTGALEPSRSTGWLDEWHSADRDARAAIDGLIDGWRQPFEGRIARDVATALPDGAALVVASSMPVRDVESFAAPRTGVRFFANRGVNGIDGFVSTALGVAAFHQPTVALLGDLCFLHDANGLLGAGKRGLDATFVVVDNGGGGIFSFLPQAALPEHFERLFGTPQPVDIADIARVHDISVVDVDDAPDLAPAIEESLAIGGVNIVRVRTDRTANVTRHREVWAAVAGCR
jgi:2-succinyl-5-enolpyruvyl-6-hydroxy-3-cyclohexene-1-carboxylate synthase